MVVCRRKPVSKDCLEREEAVAKAGDGMGRTQQVVSERMFVARQPMKEQSR